MSKIESILVMGLGASGSATANMLSSRGKGGMLALHDPPRGMYANLEVEYGCTIICVPAPTTEEGRVDTSIIEECLSQLVDDSLVVIRSTIPPGTTESLQGRFPKLTLCFVPEFLTEKTRLYDAMYPTRLVVGIPGFMREDRKLGPYDIDEIVNLFPASACFMMGSDEAEVAKYVANSFYAVKTAYFCQMAELCESAGIEWRLIGGSIDADPMTANKHTDVNQDGYRGFAGKCLPKDAKSFSQYARDEGAPLTILEEAVRYNEALIASQDSEPVDAVEGVERL